MKSRIVYKAFAREGRSRVSFASVNIPKKFIVKYPLGKKITAPFGELWVFKDLIDAKKLVGSGRDTGILLCRTTDPVNRRHLRAHLTKDKGYRFENFWYKVERRTVRYLNGEVCQAPPFSYTVKSLTPIREVKI